MELVDEWNIGWRGGNAFFKCRFAYCFRHDDTDLARLCDAWKQRGVLVSTGRRKRSKRARRGHEHLVCHSRSAGDENAEREAREDVSVVDLRDADLLAVNLDRRERAAGADQGATVGPTEQIGRRGLGERGGV